MALIRKRQAQLLKAGFLGGIIGFVLCAVIYTAVSKKVPGDIRQSDENGEAVEYQEVYLLKRPLSANDRITAADYYSYKIQKQFVPEGVLEVKDFIGRYLKLSLGRNSIIIDELVSDREITDDLRIHNYNFIRLNDKLAPGEYVDIRISFADGADYVLLSKKQIIDLTRYSPEAGTENSLWIEVNEEEILRLSSAAVDAYLQESCSIYAIKYIEPVQNGLIVNYPMNETVRQLIISDPNIIDKAAAHLNSEISSSFRPAIEAENDEMKRAEDAGVSNLKDDFWESGLDNLDGQNLGTVNSNINDIEFLD